MWEERVFAVLPSGAKTHISVVYPLSLRICTWLDPSAAILNNKLVPCNRVASIQRRWIHLSGPEGITSRPRDESYCKITKYSDLGLCHGKCSLNPKTTTVIKSMLKFILLSRKNSRPTQTLSGFQSPDDKNFAVCLNHTLCMQTYKICWHANVKK